MKKLIIALLLITGFVFAQSPGVWNTGSFGSGDTTETIVLSNAKVFYLIATDSSIAGTDTLALLWKLPTNTTAYQYAPFALHEFDQTTSTTDVSSATLIMGDNSVQAYAWYPRTEDYTLNGTFLLYRKNVNDNTTPYLPKTRFAWKYEQ